MAHKLKVLHSSSENYWCEDNQHLHIDYYSLSDNSLSFIKFRLTTNEPEITLAQSQTASGSRYSNGAIEWWHKANTGQLRVRDESAQWRTLYNNSNLQFLTM